MVPNNPPEVPVGAPKPVEVVAPNVPPAGLKAEVAPNVEVVPCGSEVGPPNPVNVAAPPRKNKRVISVDRYKMYYDYGDIYIEKSGIVNYLDYVNLLTCRCCTAKKTSSGRGCR